MIRRKEDHIRFDKQTGMVPGSGPAIMTMGQRASGMATGQTAAASFR